MQSNFTNGGIIENITVYKWLNGGLVNILTVADCLGPPPSATDDVACATVNRDPVASPWPYSPKANEGTAGTFPVAAFFEGGINISRLIPDAGCFTGFLAETRSSTPFDAVLKDFVLGEFDLCSIEVVKTGDALSKVTDPVNYIITLSNTSSADTPAMTGTATDTLLGQVWNAVVPLGDTVINTSRTVQAGDPDPLVNTVNISYGLEGLPNVLTGSASHSTDLFQPAVEVIKT